MKQFLYYVTVAGVVGEKTTTTIGAMESSGSTDILYQFIDSLFIKSFYF